MKTLSLLLLLAAPAFAAELPRPAPQFKYQALWENSPFTTKPPPAASAPEANPLEDYALGGVSPVPGGYRVTLLNKKNPEERIVIPDNPDYKVLSVNYAAGNPLDTTVRITTGSKTGTVAFNKDLLVLKAAPPPQQPQQPQNTPPGVPPQPNVPGQQQGDAPRQPRPRVVPPATNGAPQPQNPQQATQLPPGVQPQQQQQQLPQRQQQQRLNRR